MTYVDAPRFFRRMLPPRWYHIDMGYSLGLQDWRDDVLPHCVRRHFRQPRRLLAVSTRRPVASVSAQIFPSPFALDG